jgi:hypothetical protein
LRIFYAGDRWIWRDFLRLEDVYNFERNRHFAGMNTAQSAIQIRDRELYTKGIDVSYYYEGYSEFKTGEL